MGKDAHPSFDIWALGISLYFFLAKKLPYEQPINERFTAML